jgi:hypothetical protein
VIPVYKRHLKPPAAWSGRRKAPVAIQKDAIVVFHKEQQSPQTRRDDPSLIKESIQSARSKLSSNLTLLPQPPLDSRSIGQLVTPVGSDEKNQGRGSHQIQSEPRKKRHQSEEGHVGHPVG